MWGGGGGGGEGGGDRKTVIPSFSLSTVTTELNVFLLYCHPYKPFYGDGGGGGQDAAVGIQEGHADNNIYTSPGKRFTVEFPVCGCMVWEACIND